ncbi:hypothetical protein KI387_015292, partial [Taxus chinensis]
PCPPDPEHHVFPLLPKPPDPPELEPPISHDSEPIARVRLEDVLPRVPTVVLNCTWIVCEVLLLPEESSKFYTPKFCVDDTPKKALPYKNEDVCTTID